MPTGEAAQPWLVDRLFRNLLDRRHRQHPPRRVLHRQAVLARRPDRPARPGRDPRLRDAAARAHEPACSSCCCARWSRASGATPYRGELVRWDTELHDRFMLPHFLWEDLREVVCDLERARLPVRARVVRAVPRVPLPALRHACSVGGIELELRMALEPWHVLGEEVTLAGHGALRRLVGRARCRCESTGMTDGRHVVACNGRRVPLRATGTARRVRRRRALPRLAAALGAASDHRRARAAGLRRRRHLERPLDRRLHLPRRAIRAGAATRPSRSTPTRPRRAASRASGRTATRPGPMAAPPEERSLRVPVHARPPARGSMCGYGLRAGVRVAVGAPSKRALRTPIGRPVMSHAARRCRDAAPAPDAFAARRLPTRRPRRTTRCYEPRRRACARTGRPDARARARSAPTSSTQRRREARRLLRENGVTYNVYDDPQRSSGCGRSIRSRCCSPAPSGRRSSTA